VLIPAVNCGWLCISRLGCRIEHGEAAHIPLDSRMLRDKTQRSLVNDRDIPVTTKDSISAKFYSADSVAPAVITSSLPLPLSWPGNKTDAVVFYAQ
jgi:hypothetical protein